MNRTVHILFAIALVFTTGMVVFAAPQTPANLASDCSVYDKVPLPAEANESEVPKVSPDCASYKSYRGINRPVDYAAARACAWKERQANLSDLRENPKEPTAWVVGGSLILADMYFNGAGVKRNVPLALRFACESEEDMAKLALEDIRKNVSWLNHKPFEFCDYAATTITMNFCGVYQSEIEQSRKDRYYEFLKKSMAPDQRSAFEELLQAEKAYIQLHSYEVDQGGTIRGIRTLSSQRILNDLFYLEINHFERKRWPALSKDQIAKSETIERREYDRVISKLKNRPKEERYDGEVTSDGLSKVEGAWRTYRDSWARFAHRRYPVAEGIILAQIELDRYRLLKTI